MSALSVSLKFTPKELEDFRGFEKAMKRQLGSDTYVGTDHCVVVIEYPKELKAMLRPFPEKLQYEFQF
jgi:hypothetical protein